MKPTLLVGSMPRPAPGSGLPLLAQPSESIGSGKLLSRPGRCRAASYRFCAATTSGLLRSASAINASSFNGFGVGTDLVQELRIDVTGLEQDTYELVLTVTDLISGAAATSRTAFSILD